MKSFIDAIFNYSILNSKNTKIILIYILPPLGKLNDTLFVNQWFVTHQNCYKLLFYVFCMALLRLRETNYNLTTLLQNVNSPMQNNQCHRENPLICMTSSIIKSYQPSLTTILPNLTQELQMFFATLVCIEYLGGGFPNTIEMVPKALDKLTQLYNIFCGNKPANQSSRNGDPTSAIMHPKKVKRVGIKNKKGVSYLQ